MALSIIDKINEWIEPFRSFIMKNHGNPIMWLIFILIGIVIFSMVYNTLHRNGE